MKLGRDKTASVAWSALRALLPLLAAFALACTHLHDASTVSIKVTSSRVAIMGRVVPNHDASATFGYPGVTFAVTVNGGQLYLRGSSTEGQSWLGVRVNGIPQGKIRVPVETADLLVFEAAAPGRYLVEVTHASESWHGLVTLDSFRLKGGQYGARPPLPARKILLLGDSVTCGEAIDRVVGEAKNPTWWNAWDSYGMRIAAALDAQVHLVCWGGRGLVRTWDNRTDQPTLAEFFAYAAGEGRSVRHWDHRSYQPDLIISAIGTNDFSPGIPDETLYVSRYRVFLATLRYHHPDAQIVLTEGSILAGAEKTTLAAYLQTLVSDARDSRIHYVASQQYPGDALDFHPNRAQHQAMAQDLLPELRRLMGW